MSLTSLVSAAETHSSEPAVSPYLVGIVTFLLLLVLLFSLLAFGKGRDHS